MYIRIINGLYEDWMKLEVGKALSQLEIDLKSQDICESSEQPEGNPNNRKSKKIFKSIFDLKIKCQ